MLRAKQFVKNANWIAIAHIELVLWTNVLHVSD